jgi:hypothetical protein
VALRPRLSPGVRFFQLVDPRYAMGPEASRSRSYRDFERLVLPIGILALERLELGPDCGQLRLQPRLGT